LETECDYSDRKGRDGQKKKTGKADKKRKKRKSKKRANDEEVNGQGRRKGERGTPASRGAITLLDFT